MKIKSLSRTNGLVVLAEGEDGSLVKKAILCITGTWQGMYGEVEVTKDTLLGVADRYNKEKELALNAFDYAPLQINHDRNVELTMGYIDVSSEKLTVGEHPKRKGVFCLFGPVRVDDESAKAKVKSGKYSKLSMSFDDESYELYEVSFVAVEAARGSQVLSKGDKKTMKKRTQSLALVISKNKEVSLALANGVKSISGQVTSLKSQMNEIQLKIKSAGIKGTLSSLVREGKITKDEFKKINVASLAGKDSETIGLVLDSYKSRSVSSDIAQFGVEGAKPVQTKELSAKEFKALKNAQIKGKSLAQGDGEDDDADKNKNKESLSGDDENKNGSNASLSDDDAKEMDDVLSKCMSALEEITKTISSLKSSAKSLEVEESDEDETEEENA